MLRGGVIARVFVAVLAAAGTSTSRAQAQEISLIEIVKRGDRSLLRQHLKQRVDVAAPEPDGTTALHWAVRLNDLESAELLVKSGAAANAANRYGTTPLLLACVNGSAKMIELLLKAGADVNGASPEGQTPLMTAARTGEVEAVKMLLAHGAQVDRKEEWRGTTAMIWAAAEGHAATVRTLLENGADVHTRSKRGFTPLLFAIREGHLQAVEALAAAGADVNDKTPDGTSALVLAIINAHYELASWLVDNGADANAPDSRGSALHAIAWMRRPGRAPGAVAQPVQTGRLSSLDLARNLLVHRANPNVRIAWKETKKGGFQLGTEVDLPPEIAIGRNYLIFGGATPFYLASKHSDVELMRLLADNGADPLIPTVHNVTPLMAAAGIGFWQGESPGPNNGVPESDTLEAVKLALELGGDINAAVNFGNVHIEGDGVSLLHTLALNREEYPEQGDIRWDGSTAMHGAALRGVNSVVQFLLENGGRLDVKNRIGWTPLMVAEGMYIGQTEKEQPHTAALIRKALSARAEEPSPQNSGGQVAVR